MEEIEKLTEPCECGNKEIKVTYDDEDDYENPLSMKCTKCGKEHITRTERTIPLKIVKKEKDSIAFEEDG